MRRLRAIASAALAILVVCVAPAAAQGPPPKIGPLTIDLQGTIARFPSDDSQLSDSRGLLLAELPGSGFGLHGAATYYPLKWKAVTFGIGVDATVARSHRGARLVSTTVTGRAVTERFSHIAPDISFNFGTGDGYSYISGGIGPGVWYLVPDGGTPIDGDYEHLQTINYGGGARWFLNRHVAFSLDVRFYAIAPSTPASGFPSSPRTTLLFFGGGISLK